MDLLTFHSENLLEAGCDEAGRGCLAGPVVAAAVILPVNFCIPSLNDSKKLSETQRYRLRTVIECDAVAWAIGVADHTEIDRWNILNATFLAMHRAIGALSVQPELLLIDGNRFSPYQHINHRCIVGGDGKYMSIAAASVLAKTYRDDMMNDLHRQHPQYAWNNNKGYPTAQHRRAILQHGTTPFHRMSFTLLKHKKDVPSKNEML